MPRSRLSRPKQDEGPDPDAYKLDEKGNIVPDLPPEEWEISAILVKARGGFQAQQIMYNFKVIDDRATAVNPATVMREFFSTFLSGTTAVLLLIACLVTIVAAISIMTTIYNSVSARRREIAILRALGATRNRILSMICIEACTVGLLGAIAGFLAGHLLSAAGSHYLSRTVGEGIQLAAKTGWEEGVLYSCRRRNCVHCWTGAGAESLPRFGRPESRSGISAGQIRVRSIASGTNQMAHSASRDRCCAVESERRRTGSSRCHGGPADDSLECVRKLTWRRTGLGQDRAYIAGYPLYSYIESQLHGGIFRHGDLISVDLQAMSDFEMNQVLREFRFDSPTLSRSGRPAGRACRRNVGAAHADGKLSSFDLVYSIGKCCFIGPPKVQHFVKATLPPGKTASLSAGLVTVTGILHVGVRRTTACFRASIDWMWRA